MWSQASFFSEMYLNLTKFPVPYSGLAWSFPLHIHEFLSLISSHFCCPYPESKTSPFCLTKARTHDSVQKKSLYIKHFIIFVDIIEDLAVLREKLYWEACNYALPLAPCQASSLPLLLSLSHNQQMSCSILSRAIHSENLASQLLPTMICQEISFEKVTALTLHKIPLKIIFPNN